MFTAVVGALCLVAACSSETTDGGTSGSAPPEAGVAGGPGTPLGAGVEVVEGTTLVADPYPFLTDGGDAASPGDAGADRVEAGWSATTVVDGGDPLAIIDAYLDQAARNGMEAEVAVTCTPDLLPREVTCTGFARSADPDEPRSLGVTFLRGQRADLVSNHVVVVYSTSPETWEWGAPDVGGGRDLSLPAPPTFDPLPGPGEQLPADGEVERRITVQPGSRLAGPPHLSLLDATGGIEAILEVTGDPLAVLDAYIEHLHELGLEGSAPTTERAGGTVVTSAFANVAGGDHVALRLVERAGRPTWLWLSAGHD